MALRPFPPLAVKGTQESNARGGAQQQSQPGAGTSQGPQSRHDAPAAPMCHQEQRGGRREIRERVVHHPTTHRNQGDTSLPKPGDPNYTNPNPDSKDSAAPGA